MMARITACNPAAVSPAGQHSDAHAGGVAEPGMRSGCCGYFQRIVIDLDLAPKVVWLFVASCTLTL